MRAWEALLRGIRYSERNELLRMIVSKIDNFFPQRDTYCAQEKHTFIIIRFMYDCDPPKQ